MFEHDEALIRRTILRSHPELSGSAFTFLTAGWDSIAVDVDDRLIFKFPRQPAAEVALKREASLLAALRPQLALAVPVLRLNEGGRTFSVHEKLKGDHLLADDYSRLPDDARRMLAADLGRFYAELHSLGVDSMRNAGAGPIAPWQSCDAVRARALPRLLGHVREWAEETIAAFEALPPDPLGTTYGMFDGHGWNMAFDHGANRLIGVYDFADSGFGPVHQDFIYSNFISSELTERIITSYEKITAHRLDRRRIGILTGMHRLSELSEMADDPASASEMLSHVADWATVVRRTG